MLIYDLLEPCERTLHTFATVKNPKTHLFKHL